MRIPERLRNGKYRCNCKDIKLKCYEKELKRRVGNADWRRDLAVIVIESVKYKSYVRWVAYCDQCEKLYIASETKEGLLEALKTSGMDYECKDEICTKDI